MFLQEKTKTKQKTNGERRERLLNKGKCTWKKKSKPKNKKRNKLFNSATANVFEIELKIKRGEASVEL